ncbi:MAG: response regulator [Acidobacteriota bacterium]|nr:response regulator [Acidobacteriota bacterium]
MKQRVLVVDDDKLVADTLSLIFRANGFDAEACYSAAEGLERARIYDPELLLCDVTMPGATGLELAANIDREMPACKILMLTAYSSNAVKVDEQSRRMARPVNVLSKPCRPEDLLREVGTLLKTA